MAGGDARLRAQSGHDFRTKVRWKGVARNGGEGVRQRELPFVVFRARNARCEVLFDLQAVDRVEFAVQVGGE